MKGKDGKDCYASGGGVKKGEIQRHVMAEFHGARAHNEADDALKRGGRIHRKHGGKAESEYKEEKTEPEEGGEPMKKGGRAHRKHGGHIEGEGHKPHMGRAGRARGGRAGKGADLHPVTHDAGVGPKQRKIMSESEKVP